MAGWEDAVVDAMTGKQEGDVPESVELVDSFLRLFLPLLPIQTSQKCDLSHRYMCQESNLRVSIVKYVKNLQIVSD
jgi:hypothetical protein